MIPGETHNHIVFSKNDKRITVKATSGQASPELVEAFVTTKNEVPYHIGRVLVSHVRNYAETAAISPRNAERARRLVSQFEAYEAGMGLTDDTWPKSAAAELPLELTEEGLLAA
jgi:hypothetical protein